MDDVNPINNQRAPAHFMALHGARMVDNGYTIVPITPGEKIPGQWDQHEKLWRPRPGWRKLAQGSFHPEILLPSWMAYPPCGIGVVTGVTKDRQWGVGALDMDLLDVDTAGNVMSSIEESLGFTSPCLRVGQHPKAMLIFRIAGNFKKIVMHPLEFLADGQQFVAYGIHPKTGTEYFWPNETLADIAIDDLPLVTEAQMRAAMEAAYKQIPQEMKPQLLLNRSADEGEHVSSDLEGDPEGIAACMEVMPNCDLPWDDWNKIGMALYAAHPDKATAQKLFEEFSARSEKNLPEVTKQRWRGYERSPPHSLGMGTLVHYATSLSDEAINADIPFNAAKRAAGDLDFSELLTRDMPKSANSGVSDISAAEQPDFTWDSPDLQYLGSGRRSPPAFPIHIFEDRLAEFIRHEAEGRCAPIDYVACSLLSLGGSALGNARWVQGTSNWREPPVLWMGLVGEPSSGKSPGLQIATKVATKMEQMAQANSSLVIRQHRDASMVANIHLKAWKLAASKAVKTKKPAPPIPAEARLPAKPELQRYIIDDATPEAVADLYSKQPRGLMVIRDELSGWIGGFDRYNSGSGEKAMWLEAYNGGPRRIDRKTSPPILVPRLSIGILGGVQPERLHATLSDADDGFVARFLWSWPDVPTTVWLRDHDSKSDLAIGAFKKLYDLLMVEGLDGPEPVYRPISREAREALQCLAQDMHRRARIETGIFASALGKVRGQTLRLALVIEYLNWAWLGDGAPEPREITLNSMERAIELVLTYFVPMAERTLAQACVPVEDSLAIVLARKLAAEGAREFNASDWRYIITELRDAKKMKTACDTLSKAGLIRRKASTGRKGRRRLDYEVNPMLLG